VVVDSIFNLCRKQERRLTNMQITPETESKAQALEQSAAQAMERREESFQRCDTDGFLSQWSLGLSAQRDKEQARILRAGGVSTFPALFDLNGNRVRAKLCSLPDKFRPWTTRDVWRVEIEGGGVKWITAFPKRCTTLMDKGYFEAKEQAPAESKIVGRGKGLSGTAWVATVRTDDGFGITGQQVQQEDQE
jgi:hypothetical protein